MAVELRINVHADDEHPVGHGSGHDTAHVDTVEEPLTDGGEATPPSSRTVGTLGSLRVAGTTILLGVLAASDRVMWRVFPEKSEYSVRADMLGQMAGNSNLIVLK